MLVLDVKKCTLSMVVVKKVGMDWYISVEIFQHEKKKSRRRYLQKSSNKNRQNQEKQQ